MTWSRRARLFPLAGVATAATVAGAVPGAVLASSPALATSPAVAPSPEDTSVPAGTYESCSAYWGYGKQTSPVFPVYELVAFDVTVEGGPVEGPAPTVENGAVDVVIVLEGTTGELACRPEQVTEAQWNVAWAPLLGAGTFPTYPGPGHYPYFSADGLRTGALGAGPMDDEPGIGEIVQVGFRVVAVDWPDLLVTPTTTVALGAPFFDELGPVLQGVLPPSLTAIVAESPAGQAGVTALVDAVDGCEAEDPVPPVPSEALDAALAALAAAAGVPTPEVDDCVELGQALVRPLYGIAVAASIANRQPITVAAPVVEPVVAPRFTG